jgi:hypothetical protein
MKNFFLLLAVSALMLLPGCAAISMQAPIRSTPERLPIAERLPLRIGLLISGPTLDYKFHAKIPMGEWVYPFGKDLPEVCRQTFLQVFDSVTLVQSRDYQSYDLIVEPQFDEAATHVDMSFSAIRLVVGMSFDASDASGTKWRKNVVGDITTGGEKSQIESHGQAVSKAVTAAALAMRAELASARPKTKVSEAATKPAKAPTERLVLMPLRVGEEDKRLQGAMETALVQGLQQNYIVFAGEQVSQKAREIFLKESRNTAKKECDETRCMQGIAEAFQAELIATANVTKQDGGYFLSLSIQNIFDNKVVYSNSIPCRNCDSFQVVDKLKELSYPSP